MKLDDYDGTSRPAMVDPSDMKWNQRETHRVPHNRQAYGEWPSWWLFKAGIDGFEFAVRDCTAIKTRKGLYRHMWSKVVLGVFRRPDNALWFEIHVDGALGAAVKLIGTLAYSADTDGGIRKTCSIVDIMKKARSWGKPSAPNDAVCQTHQGHCLMQFAQGAFYYSSDSFSIGEHYSSITGIPDSAYISLTDWQTSNVLESKKCDITAGMAFVMQDPIKRTGTCVAVAAN